MILTSRYIQKWRSLFGRFIGIKEKETRGSRVEVQYHSCERESRPKERRAEIALHGSMEEGEKDGQILQIREENRKICSVKEGKH